MPQVALFGAVGAIGQSIARTLRSQGQPYRVVGRSQSSLLKAYGADPLAEPVTWDPDQPASVEAAAAGIDTLVYLVGVDYWRFELHPQLLRQTLDGAIAAGVRRILLIGTVYPYGMARSNPVAEQHPRQPNSFKGRMRKAQEDLLWKAHADGKIQATVLRLPDFYGPGVDKSLLHGAFQAAIQGGTANLVGPLDRPHEFVFVPDVGPVVCRLIQQPEAFGKTWHLGGAGVTSQRELLELIRQHGGARFKQRVIGKPLLRLLGLFDPLLREMVEMHYLISSPLILDDSALQALIGPIAKTSYTEGVRQTLAASASAPQNVKR
ncbi:SDR family oxidoreductase [Pseudomonas protegens]|uniref:SDR family oxidoreductase n=1 Tax=Pseudomonas protegens TaxID=380021 RepID=UPI001B337B07|nr:SDR family oxidoreductase [Pseudomonas protegens]MBP5105913.1 NAD-dependent epimerase/dehydratase family protein [Pseudomonas protegens]MBP5129340.1 NAD-dependent epimerase/dehydratase family protein [Pseudomonas protegens]MBP5149350.1 NAD-dependent epimerase/dehydratase family protein [Pseudomonas protegens]